MGMLDPAMFDDATYGGQNAGALNAGMLASLFPDTFGGGPMMPVPAPPGPVPSMSAPSFGGGPLMPMEAPAPAAAPAFGAPVDVGYGPGAAPNPPPPLGAPGPIDSAGLPPTSAPATSIDQPAAPPTSLLGRIGSALGGIPGKINDNSTTLLALAAGLANSQNLGQGLQRGLSLAIPAMAADTKQQQQNQSYGVIRDKLIKTGISPDEADKTARAAIGNPAIMSQIMPGLFGAKQRKFTQIGEGPFGDKEFGFADEVAGKVYRLDGSEVTGGGTGGTGGGGSEFLAKGVASVDRSLTGDDYLKQFSPEVQSAVKNYVDGKAMPTGNPRKGFTQAVKMIAQKYGEDVGTPSDDTTYLARSAMRKQLSSGGLGSLGGQINTGNTAIGHLGDLSDQALKLGNWNLFGPDISGYINKTRAHLSSDQAATVNAWDDTRERYVQEITKFYSGSPGAQGERDRAIRVFDAAKTPQELAAAIKAEAELMHSKLGALDSQIKGTLGEAGAEKYPVVRPESQRALDRIYANVSRLTGQGSSTPAPGQGERGAAPSAAVVPQHVQSLPMSEQMRSAPEGSIVRFGNSRLMKTGDKWQPMQ